MSKPSFGHRTLRATVLALVAATPHCRSETPLAPREQAPPISSPISESAEETDAATMEELRSIGYVEWSERDVEREADGVIVHDRRRAMAGYNLFSPRGRPEAYMMNMQGRIVHQWRRACDPSDPNGYAIWEAAKLLPDGDLLVLCKFRRAMRLRWDSSVVWSSDLEAHHDIAPSGRGTFFTWIRTFREHRGLRVRFGSLVELDGQGRVIHTWATYDNLDELRRKLDPRNFLDTVLDRDPSAFDPSVTYDYFHANTVNPIGPNARGELPAFRAGNVLICLRTVNQIAILDAESRAIVWSWGAGQLDWPHHPTMLPHGNILIFDNGKARGHSRVLELDPVTKEVVWQYVAKPKSAFYSSTKGSAQRLDNGNTLIADSQNGRAFETNVEGRIVWEFLFPEIKRSNRRAAIYRMTRYPQAMIDALLARKPAHLEDVPPWGRHTTAPADDRRAR